MAVRRYFEEEHPLLSKRLEDHFARVRQAFETAGLRGCLVLGGGYGRGEGGIVRGAEGDGLFNDLDYFLFDPEPDAPGLAGWAARVEREESALLGIDVEIKRLRVSSVGDPSVSMMFADLVAGHIPVAGDASFLERLEERLDFTKLPAEEAVRLLWNRGSGLFFSRCRMRVEGRKSFVIRNHAKLKLALGDAWLCLRGRYAPQCRERGERLAAMDGLAGVPRLHEWHAEAVVFKSRPQLDGFSWEELESEAAELTKAWGVLYLAAETERLDRGFGDFGEYLAWSRLMPGEPLWRNLALALRDRIKRGGCLRPLGDYPRGALMRALPCLLGLSHGGVAEAGRFLPWVPREDPTRPASWEAVYSRWWSYYA